MSNNKEDRLNLQKGASQIVLIGGIVLAILGLQGSAYLIERNLENRIRAESSCTDPEHKNDLKGVCSVDPNCFVNDEKQTCEEERVNGDDCKTDYWCESGYCNTGCPGTIIGKCAKNGLNGGDSSYVFATAVYFGKINNYPGYFGSMEIVKGNFLVPVTFFPENATETEITVTSSDTNKLEISKNSNNEYSWVFKENGTVFISYYVNATCRANGKIEIKIVDTLEDDTCNTFNEVGKRLRKKYGACGINDDNYKTYYYCDASLNIIETTPSENCKCKKDNYSCVDNNLMICKDDGSGKTSYVLKEECGVNKTCNEVTKKCEPKTLPEPICEARGYSCVDNNLMICKDDGSGRDLVEICLDDQTCNATTKTCDQKPPPEPVKDSLIPGYQGAFVTDGILKGNPTVGDIISKLLNYLYVIAGLILLVMLVMGGLGLMTAAGNPDKMKAGYGKITNAMIGFLIILVSYFVVQLVETVLGITIF